MRRARRIHASPHRTLEKSPARTRFPSFPRERRSPLRRATALLPVQHYGRPSNEPRASSSRLIHFRVHSHVPGHLLDSARARPTYWLLATFAGFDRIDRQSASTRHSRPEIHNKAPTGRAIGSNGVYGAPEPQPPSPQRRRRVGHIAHRDLHESRRTFISSFFLPRLSSLGVASLSSRTAIATRRTHAQQRFAQPSRLVAPAADDCGRPPNLTIGEPRRSASRET